MTTHYYPNEEIWEENYWLEPGSYSQGNGYGRSPLPLELPLFILVGIVVAILVGGSILIFDLPNAPNPSRPGELEEPLEERPAQPPASLLPTSPETFTAPYEGYILTQGIHGQSYGHMAIDIAAGKGEPILSPITGAVTEVFTDGIGNTVLVIENERYTVTMLHGEYTAGIGDQVTAGFPVGLESNIGNTFDMQGRSCRGRDCGYHTHLNVFDKQLGSNVSPLELLGG